MSQKIPVISKSQRKKKRKKSVLHPRKITKRRGVTQTLTTCQHQKLARTPTGIEKYTIKLSSLSTQTPPKSAAPALTMASSLSEADITNIAAKFTLREDDIDRIVVRVRDSVMDNLKKPDHIITKRSYKTFKGRSPTDQTGSEKRKITENEKLKSDISELKLAVDEQEQYSRRSCLRINGVIGDEGDPAENVESKILNLAQEHHIDVTSNDIDVAHRLGKPRPGYTRAVLVKFTNLKSATQGDGRKENIMASVHKRGLNSIQTVTALPCPPTSAREEDRTDLDSWRQGIV